jgi:uncharacterized membrane protein YphA (DoxX/SURF4 family)
MGSVGYGPIEKRVTASDVTNLEVNKTEVSTGRTAVKTLSGTRILFGLIFLFDGILKWQLLATTQMQGAVQMVNFYNLGYVNDNWLAFGVLVGVAETVAGLGLILGLFQKPSALVASMVMFFIWGFSGYGGAGYAGYTDPGGDLMLALIFLALVFAPTAYGLAARFHLRERLAGPSIARRVVRFLVA